MTGRAIKVLFIVPNLSVGGAERHVTTLLPRMDPERFTPSVVCIGEQGGLFADLPAAGITARALNLGGKWQMVAALRELLALLRRDRPDVVVVRGYNAEHWGVSPPASPASSTRSCGCTTSVTPSRAALSEPSSTTP